jgi:long-chain acyl-CoA synthetase
MNLALWLERAGMSHGDRPALGLGSRVVRSYAECAGRVARLAASLRQRFDLEAGERVAIVAKNSPDYLELMFGIWHAGLAAVPANAKLHGRELAYILEHSGARICFTSHGLDTEIAAHAPATLKHLITIGGAKYEALFATGPVEVWPCRGTDLAWLFYTSGTTGRPKGAMLTHGVLAAASYAYAAEVDPIAPGDALLHAAPMSHGSGVYMMATVARLGINVAPESSSFDAEEVLRLFDVWPHSSMFAAPTMVKRLVECRAEGNPDYIRTIIWGGAPMYVADALKAIERFGPRFAQIYGQGEVPMTITTLSKHDIADREHPRWAERLGAPLRRSRRGAVPRRRGDGGLLAQPRGIGGDAERRLAAHRRYRLLRQRGVSHPEGPLQGRHHLGRLQHLSARGRGGAARACAGTGGLGDRPARPGMGRGRRCLCGG